LQYAFKKLDPTVKEEVFAVVCLPRTLQFDPSMRLIKTFLYGGQRVQILFDTGSRNSFISYKLVSHLPLEEAETTLISATGHELAIVGETMIKVLIGEKTFRHKVLVRAPTVGKKLEVIFGTDFLGENEAIIDYQQGRLTFCREIDYRKPPALGPDYYNKKLVRPEVIKTSEEIMIRLGEDIALSPGESYYIDNLDVSCFKVDEIAFTVDQRNNWRGLNVFLADVNGKANLIVENRTNKIEHIIEGTSMGKIELSAKDIVVPNPELDKEPEEIIDTEVEDPRMFREYVKF
jgi:Retroviral aspartyl protease